jgi:hypothetical protein
MEMNLRGEMVMKRLLAIRFVPPGVDQSKKGIELG